MNFANLKVGMKLGIAFVAMLLFSIVISLVAWIQLGKVHDSTEEITGHWMVGTRILGDTEASLSEYRQAEILVVLGMDALEVSEKRLQVAKSHTAEVLSKYQERITSDEERRLFDELKLRAEAHYLNTGKILQMARAGDSQSAESKRYLTGGSRTSYRTMVEAVTTLLKFNTDRADAANAAATADYAQARNWILGLLALMITVAVVFMLRITRLIRTPIEDGARAARQISDGDLTMQIHAQGGDETADLLRALSGMKDTLASMVGEVRSNSEAVASASAQIASGNNDLSARTEQQATALEQTAASMLELNSTVQQNADNARQANQLATSASAVAIKGGEVVEQVVETMRGINESSRKISDIIGVIDSIAFQTNILALNAAVEAARAGDEGRGFAVVASEVRSLAGRSAGAAKEIKSLIDASVERVGHGSQLVDQAGATMTEVVSAIRRVTDIVGEISVASDAQATGVAQIDQAVRQLDTTTQQNAALVEQMAAAAGSLKSQAQELVTAVSVFRTA